MRLSPTELARLAYDETGWRGRDLAIAVAIALGESGGDPAIRSKVDKPTETWGVSLGLWQVRPLNAEKGKGGPRDETLLADPVHNARSAYQIYVFAGNRFTPWGAFTNGSYKRHLAVATRAVDEVTMTISATADAVLKEAAGELGYTESPRGSNKTKFAAEAGHANGYAWCRTFTVAIAKRCGLAIPVPESAYTPTAANAYRQLGRFDRVPRVGSEAFFDFPDSKTRIQHVGWVEAWGTSSWGPWVQTIDGNTSDGTGSEDNGGAVCRRVRPMNHVVGFGHPNYEEDWFAMATKEDLKEAIREVLDEEPSKRRPRGTRYLVKLILDRLSYDRGEDTFPFFGSRIDRIEETLARVAPEDTPEP